MPAKQDRERRVVVYFVTGRRKGLRRIIGHMILGAGDTPPASFKNVIAVEGEPGRDMRLVAELPRYVLYKEVVPRKTPLPKSWKPFVQQPEGAA